MYSCSVVDKFCKDIDLTGIDVLKENIRVIENERRNMQQKSTSSLIEALNAENETQVKFLTVLELLWICLLTLICSGMTLDVIE